MNRVERDTHENTADGMNGIMAVEAFVHQPVECLRHGRRVPQRNLVFDHHMGDRMRLGVFKLHPRAAMVVNHQIDPFRFIKFEPSIRIGLLICVVLHGNFSCCMAPGTQDKV